MIRFQDVHKTYKSKSGSVEALKGVTFDIADGEFVFVIGKSGSGKSTLLKCITCEERPTEGSVLIDGFNIASMSRALVPVLRRQIGMIYQDFRLIETKTVFENIAFAGEIVGMPRKSLNQSVQLMLNVVGLKDKANAYPQELSGGEQQRVAIARAMINNPQIIVADEPTGNLDPEISENIMALLQEINRNGSTVIVCTHDSNLVDKMKKRVIEISGGLVARDAEDSLYSSDLSAQAAAEPKVIMPKPQMNIAFGDDPNFDADREYHDSYDDEGYVQEDNTGVFFFGETPEEALIPAKIEEAPETLIGVDDLAVEHEEVLESASEINESAESSDVNSSDEVSETTEAESSEASEEKKEEVSSSEETEKEEETESSYTEFASPSEVVSNEADAEEVAEEETEEENNDDNWIEEIKLSDIDLDIQEDDD